MQSLSQNLSQRRLQIERILKQHFSESEFNISAPLALIDYPLIHSAFVLLHLMQEANRWEIQLDTISQFLLSPFFIASKTTNSEPLSIQAGKAGQSLQSSLASIDIFLRENREREYSVKRLLQLLEYFNKTASLSSRSSIESSPGSSLSSLSGCQAIITLLNNLFALLPSLCKKQRAAEWREICVKILETGQWLPYQVTDHLLVTDPHLSHLLSDSELQQKTQWEEVLEDYLKMDRVLGPHSFSQCVTELKRLTKLKRFLPVLPENAVSDAPIQVLGLLEAQGLPFDTIWVVGLHQGIWPAAPDPNPFILLPLQKKHNMPHSSPSRELMIAKKIMAEWQRATDLLIFSYPTSSGTDICEKSALLDEFDESVPLSSA